MFLIEDDQTLWEKSLNLTLLGESAVTDCASIPA